MSHKVLRLDSAPPPWMAQNQSCRSWGQRSWHSLEAWIAEDQKGGVGWTPQRSQLQSWLPGPKVANLRGNGLSSTLSRAWPEYVGPNGCLAASTLQEGWKLASKEQSSNTTPGTYRPKTAVKVGQSMTAEELEESFWGPVLFSVSFRPQMRCCTCDSMSPKRWQHRSQTFGCFQLSRWFNQPLSADLNLAKQFQMMALHPWLQQQYGTQGQQHIATAVTSLGTAPLQMHSWHAWHIMATWHLPSGNLT